MAFLLLTACGGGDNVGNLTMTTPVVADAGNGQYAVSATATYSNPNHSDLTNTEIIFDTSPSGIVSGFPAKLLTATNGSKGVNFVVDQAAQPISFYLVARTGDLQDSKLVTIPALGALTANPTTLTFLTTDVVPANKSITVSGGAPPYSVASSDTNLATATVTGTTVTVTRGSNTTGTVTITITDSQSKSTPVSVTLQ